MKCDIPFPYGEPRKGQMEVAESVYKAVNEGGLVNIQAPTGFGKTVAVLYGLLCAGAEKTLYVVRTVNEIDPVIRELRRFDAEYTFLYSARRMCPLFQKSTEMSHEEFWAACKVARLKGICPYYSMLEEVDPELVRELLRSYEKPRGRDLARALASRLGVCPFFALRAQLDNSKVIVATYPYLFREDIFASVLDPYEYSDFVVVVDEAHSLINAHNMLEYRIKVEDVERAIEEVKQYSPSSSLAVQLLEKLKQILIDLIWKVRGQTSSIEKEVVETILADLDIIHDVAEEIRQRILEEALLDLANRVPKTYITRVETWLLTLAHSDVFLFAERLEDGTVEYVATPMDPSVVVKKPLESAKSVILMSGTLPKGDYVRELLGVERATTYLDVELLFGSFLQRENIFTVVASNVTTRYRERTPEMYRTLAAYVASISRLMPGSKLAVYPSYDVMREVVGKLPIDIPAVVETRKTSIAEVHDKLVENPEILINAVANGKLVEGVEFVIDSKNLLSTVIIVGVPYPQPDAYTRTRLEVLSKRIGPARSRYYVYTFNAMVKVKQALGRATRSPEDKAAYFLLDYRFLRKDLRELLRLPINRVIGSLEGLVTAIAEAKRKLFKGTDKV